MLKKLLVPTVVLSVGLAGCASGETDVAVLQAENELLKQEIAALKEQAGSSASSDSSKTTFTAGENIVYNGVTYSFELKERTTTIADGEITAGEGKEFLLYNISIHNTSEEDYSYSQSDYSIVLSTGEIEGNHLIIDFKDVLPDDLSSGDLASGGKKTGWVAFQVPAGEEPIELRYEKKSFTKGVQSFKVKL